MPVTTAKTSIVSVVTVTDSVQESVRQAMELACWRDFLEEGRPTCLKINLGWDLFIPGAITSPWVIEGVIQTIQERVGPISIVESDQVLENIEKAFRKSRLQRLLDHYKVKWVNMTNGPVIRVRVDGAVVFQELELPRILSECQLITIPVMKTHAKTQITGAIKNQWGCISKLRHNYHLVLDDALADINSAIRPVFAVMDATIGLEGNGPKSGHPRIVNKILASPDIVAIDTIQAKLMGLDPGKIAHVQNCALRGLGNANLSEITILGDAAASTVNLHFTPARHNIVSRIEELLRRSRLRKLVFGTPLFSLMLAGAKIWYYIWFYGGNGKKYWKAALQHPLYGKEWKEMRRP